MVYDKEDFNTDIDWLRGQGVDTSEIEEVVLNLIKQGFMMTRKEYIKFMESVKE